jgi:hypothetical protein
MSFDEMYDEMLHDEFRTGSTPGSSVPAKGVARYRTAALVSAGGLAAATAGAFLGGLGGYFTLSPSGASPISSASQQVPLTATADAAIQAAQVAAPAASKAASAVSSAVSSVTNSSPSSAAATFAAAVGPLLNGVTTLTAPTISAPTLTTSSTDGVGSTSSPAAPKGSVAQQASQILTVSLTDILGNLTQAIGAIASVPGDPSVGLANVITPLTGVLTDVTGTLSDLSSLMPLPVVSSLPTVLASAPLTGGPKTSNTSTGTKGPSSAATALAPVLNSVAASLGGSTGSGLPALPSLPLPSSDGTPASVPSLPVTTLEGALPKLPTITLPALPVVGTVTLPVPTVTSTAASGTCVSVPLPALPVSVPTISVGPISVGVKSGGSSSGATVCAGS